MGELTVTLMERLGFTVNRDKSVLEPVQSIQFLGFLLDSVEMKITVPGSKLEKIRTMARTLLHQEKSSGRELACFVGTASSMMLAIPPAPLFYRALQTAKNKVIPTPAGLDTPITLDPSQKEELLRWLDQAQLWNGSSINPPRQLLKVQTDVSMTGWGPCVQGMSTGGPWSLKEGQHDINYLDLLVIFLAIQTFAGENRELTILIQTDNRSAMSYVNKRGGTHSASLTQLAKKLWQWCMDRKISLVAEHIPGLQNQAADEEWETTRQMGLEVEPLHFEQNQSNMGTPDSGLVCYQKHNPA